MSGDNSAPALFSKYAVYNLIEEDEDFAIGVVVVDKANSATPINHARGVTLQMFQASCWQEDKTFGYEVIEPTRLYKAWIKWDGCGHIDNTEYVHTCGISALYREMVLRETAFIVASKFTNYHSDEFGNPTSVDPDFQQIDFTSVHGDKLSVVRVHDGSADFVASLWEAINKSAEPSIS